MRLVLILVLSGLVFTTSCWGKSASVPAAPASGEVSATDVDATIRALEDPGQRAKLIEQLKLLRDAQKQQVNRPVSIGENLLASASARLQEGNRWLGNLTVYFLEAPQALANLWRWFADAQVRMNLLGLLVTLAAVLGAAFGTQYITERLLARPRMHLETRQAMTLPYRLVSLLLDFILRLVPLAVFGLTAHLVLPFASPGPESQLIVLTIANAILLIRGLLLVGMILFMPDISALRMFALSDESARYGMRWWRRFVLIGVVSYFAVELADLLEVPGSLVTLFTQAVGLCMVIMALVVIFQNRARMAHKLLHRAKRPTAGVHGLRRRFAETWHVFAAVYVMGLYAVWALGLPGGFSFLMRASIVTLIVFAFTRIVAELVSRAIAGSLAASAHLGARLPGLESRLGRYLPLLLRVAQVVVYALAITVLAEAWGLQPFRVLASATGQHIANALASIAVVLIVAAISWEALNIFIDHYLSTQASQGRHRRQRMQTLLPLLRNITRLSLSVLVGLIILSQLGIDIAPLLAGAGVIGLAVGFGAQSLVKDVITGVFLVAEDTIAVGDLVNIDSHEGRVEAMTVRSVSIRDDEGALHTLPYSLIESIKNMSKDYAVAILEIPFNRSVHYEDAAALMEEIGQELKSGEAGKIILSDLNLSGVSKISDNAMTVRATMRVAPGARRRITRAFNLLLKRKLESAGLELAKS